MAFEIKIKNSISPPTFQGLGPLTMKGDSTVGGGGVGWGEQEDLCRSLDSAHHWPSMDSPFVTVKYLNCVLYNFL